MKLEIELVPKTCWYSNVRSCVKPSVWDKLRKATYAEYNHKCGICETKGRLEAHEIWNYDDESQVQKLVGMIALCPDCHKIKHWGLSEVMALQGKVNLAKLMVHFCKVNDCDANTFLEHKESVWKTWLKRSAIQWKLNIEYLEKFGDVFEPPHQKQSQ